MTGLAFATDRVARTDTPFARDVLAGLARRGRCVPSRWLYDHRGSELFEEITFLDAYYLTRAEIRILERFAPEIGPLAGPRATVVEFGSGSGRKTPLLLSALDRPGLYVPVDISAQFLIESVGALKSIYPRLPVQPVIGDITSLHTLALPPASHGRRVGFFPGSSIGNYTPDAAANLLVRFGRILGPGSLLLVGADATQDPARLLPAYDDARGLGAAFHRNLLTRINRELAGDFALDRFAHEVRWDAQERCLEQHLVAREAHTVEVLGRSFHFAEGEGLLTECAYQHGALRFQAIARQAGWQTRRVFSEAATQFNLYLLELGA
ncbi:L-histidine N(alpha)-methyltransferase [Aquabacterium sp.]|uniref:L-histidine N(alpha)-methyltransferase n=1 Tax=Aquabacterium sp. TaxID=1872578 RepID=UPI0037830FCC